jgi:phage baseplate assembly protein gpV
MHGRRHGDEIVSALLRLGCQVIPVIPDDGKTYFVARANVRAKSVRRWWIPHDQEQAIVESLDLTMHEYMQAIRANATELSEHGPGSSHLIAAASLEEESE